VRCVFALEKTFSRSVSIRGLRGNQRRLGQILIEHAKKSSPKNSEWWWTIVNGGGPHGKTPYMTNQQHGPSKADSNTEPLSLFYTRGTHDPLTVSELTGLSINDARRRFQPEESFSLKPKEKSGSHRDM